MKYRNICQRDKQEFTEVDILYIRQEELADHDTIYHIAKEAFLQRNKGYD